jgi:hypothetical protein
MLEIGKEYTYIDKKYVYSVRTGYFLGCIKKEVPSQSFHDDNDIGLFWVFGSTPKRDINGKHNEFVRDDLLGDVFELVPIKNFRQ